MELTQLALSIDGVSGWFGGHRGSSRVSQIPENFYPGRNVRIGSGWKTLEISEVVFWTECLKIFRVRLDRKRGKITGKIRWHPIRNTASMFHRFPVFFYRFLCISRIFPTGSSEIRSFPGTGIIVLGKIRRAPKTSRYSLSTRLPLLLRKYFYFEVLLSLPIFILNRNEKYLRQYKSWLKINVETSDFNPHVMCTSKSKNNWRQTDFDQTV